MRLRRVPLPWRILGTLVLWTLAAVEILARALVSEAVRERERRQREVWRMRLAEMTRTNAGDSDRS